jgi:sugar phosphate isomerase/epimerase
MSDRRAFLQQAGVVIAGGLLASPASADAAVGDVVQSTPAAKKARLGQLAANSYPIRPLFKRRPGGRENPAADEMKKKYGELTLLDFPQFTKDTFPGVTKMDVWSSLFGDVADDSMYMQSTVTRDGRSTPVTEFDPSAASSKKWLDQLAAKGAAAGVAFHHVSNNAPRNIADLDEAARRTGIDTAKKWLDACQRIGAKTMRVNTGGPRIIPSASATTGYPRNDEVVKYLTNAIASFKEMADYGGKVGVKVTIENHWGLSADPMNIRIILDELKHPYCEASPDFFNWEHEFMLYHGLEALMPYTHTTVHAKYWNRWDPVDVGRCVRILDKAGYKGAIALEYEDGPWDGVEGAKQLMKLVMDA